MPPPALMDDLVGEILLRFPPDEPELLVRASLVSKRWCSLVSDPGFRRRFREFHRTPPVLGCFYIGGSATEFAPASSVRLPHAVRGDWCAIDARDGLVLLHTEAPWEDQDELLLSDLVVWDPVTGEQRVVPPPPTPPVHAFPFYCTGWTAAVLGATAGGRCNNIDCRRSSFLVVFLCTGSRKTFTCVYSSDSGAWSGPTSVQLPHASVVMGSPSVLVGNALHYVSDNGTRRRKILEHHLGTLETSLISLPRTPYEHIVLTAMGESGLGFAAVYQSKLFLWSREAGGKAYAGWTQSRVLELNTLLGPIGPLPSYCDIVCLVDGITAVFKGTDGVFIANILSRQVKKICEGRCIFNIVPYTSFYTPALRVASTGDGPKACASIA